MPELIRSVIDVQLEGIAWDAIRAEATAPDRNFDEKISRKGRQKKTPKKMLPGRGLIVVAFGVCLLAALIEVSEAMPRIRHQKGGTHCSRCGPGWGVVNRCVRGRDTECGKCSPGTYSPHHSTHPCWICSRCGPGLYEAHPCTTKADTVCDSCHRPAPDNPDYHRKCNGRTNLFLAPEDAQGTGEESVLVNEPDGQEQLLDGKEVLEKDAEAAIVSGELNSLERL